MTRCLTAFRAFACRFAARKNGTLAIWLAASLIPIILAVGIGIDVARAYVVKVRLGAALDDAGLAVAATTNTSVNLQMRLNQYFYGNYAINQIGVPTAVTMSNVNGNSDIINLNATATVAPLFMAIVGFGPMTVAAYSQVTKAPTGLEVALVLDNTDSMECGDGAGNWSSQPTIAQCSQNVPPSHIDSLIADVKIMVNQLFAANTTNNLLKMSVVPYVTSVNVAGAFGSNLATYVPSPGGVYTDVKGKAILDPYGKNITYDATQNATGYEWWGCVIEPIINSQNISEPAGGWSGPWAAYYWQPNIYNGYAGMYGGPGAWFKTSVNNGNTTVALSINYDPIDGDFYNSDIKSAGPNLGCPSPMTRLTTTQATVQAAIGLLGARENSGTMIPVGTIWGWRSIAPDPPLSDGLAYNTQGWKKVVVLETDGINNIYCDPGHNTKNEPLTGLSYCADGRMGSTNSAGVLTALDSDLTSICTAMKSPQYNIMIYTIGLGQGANNTAMQNCAGNGGTFFAAPTAASLQAAFATIASQLNSIRLSQ